MSSSREPGHLFFVDNFLFCVVECADADDDKQLCLWFYAGLSSDEAKIYARKLDMTSLLKLKKQQQHKKS